MPQSQINLEGLAYIGLWDADSNTPAISDGVGEDADFYFASSSATVDLGSGPVEFIEGDIVIYFDGVWSPLPPPHPAPPPHAHTRPPAPTRPPPGPPPHHHQPPSHA